MSTRAPIRIPIPTPTAPTPGTYDEATLTRHSKAIRHTCRDYLLGRCARQECKFAHTVPPELMKATTTPTTPTPTPKVRVLQPAAPTPPEVVGPSVASLRSNVSAQLLALPPPTVAWTHIHYYDNIEAPHTDQLSRLVSSDCMEHAIVCLAGPWPS